MIKKNIRELLFREEKARRQIFAPFLSGLGLTPGEGQARILYYLLKKDHITQKELADECGLDTATMSRNIDKLMNMGFLTRETNPDCRRSFLIDLTEKGLAEAGKIKKVFNQFDDMLCKDISEDDMAIFRNVLIKMCENMDAYKN